MLIFINCAVIAPHERGFTFCLFVCLSGCGGAPCVIRNRARWMIQRPRLTDKSWHLMCEAVGQSPPGPFPRVNSQLECQKRYTSLSSLLFLPCSLHRHTSGALKGAQREPFEHSGCAQRDVAEPASWLLFQTGTFMCYHASPRWVRWVYNWVFRSEWLILVKLKSHWLEAERGFRPKASGLLSICLSQ